MTENPKIGYYQLSLTMTNTLVFVATPSLNNRQNARGAYHPLRAIEDGEMGCAGEG